ncbi:MAG: LytTR family DNA-binding domain-containing protein [Arcicella sp.]|nr:LytTR family DNA-binding domain-containing protein [Arcicella sp.]
MTLNAILVDDEPAARSMLRQIITEHCPMITLVDEASDVKSAVKLINKHRIDLVFLDIEMPEENGFSLFEYFNQPTFETVFCTAYSEYALQAFEVSAVDYILKPISISKVILAVEKAIKLVGQNQIIQRVNALKENLSVSKLQKIALPMADSLVFVQLEDIFYFEADGSYTHVVTKTGKTLVSKKIKEFDELLSNDNRFYRIHRSFLINTNQIQKYNKKDGATIEFANGFSAPVAREKVKEFDEFIAGVRV